MSAKLDLASNPTNPSVTRKTVDTTTNKPKVVQSDKSNVLNKYRSSTYNFSLSALRKDIVNDPKQYRNSTLDFVIIQSGGKGTQGISTNVSAVDRVVGTEEIVTREGGRVLARQTKNIIKQDFSGKDLSRKNFSNAILNKTNLSNANLTSANLKKANLKKANLNGANLNDANLEDADFTGADLTSANFTDADLTNAYLMNAYLQGAYLSGAIGLPDISWIIPGCLAQLTKIIYGFYLEKENKYENFIQDSIGFFIQDNVKEKTFDILAGDRIIRDIPNWVKLSGLKQIESV
jgi:uncharacterized protein YjbI with pentapeptide repeats